MFIVHYFYFKTKGFKSGKERNYLLPVSTSKRVFLFSLLNTHIYAPSNSMGRDLFWLSISFKLTVLYKTYTYFLKLRLSK